MQVRILKNKILKSREKRFAFPILLLLLFCQYSFAQSDKKLIRDGNKLYKDKKYSDAEVSYRKSLNVNKDSKEGTYNLGNAYYKQGKFNEAEKQYQDLFSSKDLSDDYKAKSFHNLGNTYLKDKKYQESIEAYKNSLKLNPHDNDTRYNLAYAQAMLQQQQQQQQNKDDKNNKDKNQEKQQQQNKQDQQKDQDKKDQQQQQQGDQQKQDKEKEAQAQRKKGISKEDADKILQALNNDEKNTQKKLTKKEATRISIDKQW